MLSSEDRNKIERHIDGVLSDIRKRVEELSDDMDEKQRLYQVADITVSKMTPESKMMLSGICKQLTAATLRKPLYSDPKIKAAFYQEDIPRQITESFDFSVPSHIDFDEIDVQMKKLAASGAVVIGASGIISISIKSLKPLVIGGTLVGVAAVIAAIWLSMYKNKKRDEADVLIDQYLMNIKKSLMSWIKSIEEFYDQKVNDFERRFS